MDLETENRLAALLMEEARRLRLQAEKEGVNVYLRNPNVRARPNSRFLTATVLGVQQANRAVEVSEMWRAREKELGFEAKVDSRSKDDAQHTRGSNSRLREDNSSSSSHSSSKRQFEDCNVDEDAGLRDEEVEKFLHSRSKRGRGAIGSRMDEPGPYLSLTSSGQDGQVGMDRDMQLKERGLRILGPEKPDFLKSEEPRKDAYRSKVRNDETCGSSKRHSEERRSKKEKSGKTKRKERRPKHHHKSRRKE